MDRRIRSMKQIVREAKKAYRDNGRSWTKAARKLGVSRGTLIRVAHGYEPKTPNIRRALGLRTFVVIEACKKCGGVHPPKRCPVHKTFEDNCREYDTWLSDPKTQRQLQAMLEWSETPPPARGQYEAPR